MRGPALAACLVAALGWMLAACGSERTKLPALTVSRDAPRMHYSFRRVGMAIDLPAVAPGEARRAPGVFRSSVGQSFIAGYAYRRAEQLPRGGRDLDAARRRLVREIRRRERGFRLIRSRDTRAAGARAVEVVGDQRIARGTMRTRSLHVYKGESEYVLDMLAPVGDFAEMDRSYFSPAVGSLKLTGKVERRGRT